NIKYDEQLKIKKQVVKDALERIGNQKDFVLFDTLGMEDPFYYRNKSSLPLDKNKRIGFYKKRSHNLVSIDECVIQGQLMNEIMNEIQKKVIDLNISTYDEKVHIGLLRHIVIRESKSQGNLMIIFAINGKSFKCLDILVEYLTKKSLN
ncbi:MAG: 23S rRNA (uracil-5-)-methyltransferase RumA, partial [Clostridiales bacterium]|nr:23S rRNA (uracil-5-)-methyltransferase RumA [Clostridiales bacterium]